MEWQVVLALVLAIPIVLFPAVFIWYINIGGIYMAIKKARERRLARVKQTREMATVANRKQ